MNRYDNIETVKSSGTRKFKRTVKLPIIEVDANDIYIVGMVGDRLDNLAHKYYGRASYWWIIARANNIGNGDFTVPIGKQLRIPQDVTSIIDEYNALNT